MALPRFLYGDPSKHVDFVRRKRKEFEESQQGKAEKAKQGLEKLFKNRETLNEQK